jgi:PKD repeat protein
LSSWQWNFGDAGSSQNTSALKNPQHVYDNAGVYDVSLTVFTNFSCSSSLQLPITISQTPVADFSYSATCEDVAVDFLDESTGIIDSWEWQIGSTTYTTQNPTHTFVNPGNTNAILTITASNDCIGSISKPIVVPAKLIADFSVSKNCVDQQTLFTDITNDTVDPINTYQWDVVDGASATGSPAVFTFSALGIPNVKLIVTTQTGCEYSITKPVTIIPSPSASFTSVPEIGGSPLAVQFTNTSVNATTYHWAFNDAIGSTSTEASPLFTYVDFGQYQVELTAFNAQNCSHTFSSVIEVFTPVTDVDPNLTQEQPLITFSPYPNPSTNGVLNLNWILKEDGLVNLKLINFMGQSVEDFQFDSLEGLNQFALSTTGIGSGVYFVKFNYKQITKVYRVIILE